ncbi:MAG: mandelate racemase/muconate lactonizing enzyme family protein [Minwuia sp.]|uniref:mandelate racemase/muconate lactonizing enzyme family protein n=1 Tax=Minwuia sp. TaxID=2493630 RepID=UPI003A88B5D2
MRIAKVETLRLGEFPNLFWVRLTADDGTEGVGEAFYGSKAAVAYVHETAADILLGRDPRQINAIHRDITPYVGYSGSGAEMRGKSAIDMALYDLVRRATGQPVHDLLGGLCRDGIRVYNTCAGYRYVREKPMQETGNWGLKDEAEGPYEDLDAFLTDAGALAESLLEMGVTGMKIWPFDFAAERSGGFDITADEMAEAVAPFAKIRKAVGAKMDIMCELHGLWSPPAAARIAEALKPHAPFWIEDAIRPDNFEGFRRLRQATNAQITASETVGGLRDWNRMLGAGCVDIAMPDLGWCGGLTEARKIAAVAEASGLPVAPHDCTGPLQFAASVHFVLATPNALIQEFVRAFYFGWYRELAENLPEVADGQVSPPGGPGLGTRLLPGVFDRDDAEVAAQAL